MKNVKAKGMVIIILFVLFLMPSYMLEANDNDDDYYDEEYYGEEYDDDYLPVNLDIWPDIQYVLEVDSTILAEGAIHRQYYGKQAVRLETAIGKVENYVIYKFNEDMVNEIVLLNEEEDSDEEENDVKKQYIINSVSYDEFLEMNDSFEQLFYRTLPGEELAMPGFEKIAEVDYLGRKAEEWTFTDNSEGRPVTINLIIDRELRQILKITIDGEVNYNVVKIDIKDLSYDLFNPPEDYELLEF